jgi:hypothetical protein
MINGRRVAVMVHPDYQYTPRLITSMAALIAHDVYDVVLGSRILGKGALAGGMPLAEASSIGWRRSVVYGFGCLWNGVAFMRSRMGRGQPRFLRASGRRLVASGPRDPAPPGSGA